MAADTPDWTGSVFISGTPAVTISGTVTVAISGTPAVTITGGVSVTFPSAQAVTISGTPAVTISGTPTVNIGTISGAVSITGPVNIQNVASGTIVSAGNLRLAGSKTQAANGNSVLNVTLQTYERALVIQSSNTLQATAPPALVVVADHVTAFQYTSFVPVYAGHPAIVYVDPNLGTSVDVTIYNGGGFSVQIDVFGDTSLPLMRVESSELRAQTVQQAHLTQSNASASTTTVGTIPIINAGVGGQLQSAAFLRVHLSMMVRGVAFGAATIRGLVYVTDGTLFYYLAGVIASEGNTATASEVYPAPMHPGAGVLSQILGWSIVFATVNHVGAGTYDALVDVDWAYQAMT